MMLDKKILGYLFLVLMGSGCIHSTSLMGDSLILGVTVNTPVVKENQSVASANVCSDDKQGIVKKVLQKVLNKRKDINSLSNATINISTQLTRTQSATIRGTPTYFKPEGIVVEPQKT